MSPISPPSGISPDSVPPALSSGDATRKHIRGSSLLVAGKLISTAISFVSQVLIVRYLSTTSYGALALGLSVVTFWHMFSTFGLHRAIPRFIPIYDERREYGKIFGTILLVLACVAVTLLVITTLVFVVPRSFFGLMTDNEQAIAIIAILVFLIPLQSLDEMMVSLFASLASARLIFFRTHIVAPGLKLIVVAVLILAKADVVFLAYGYVLSGLLGTAVYALVLLRVLAKRHLLERFSWAQMNMPVKEMFSFSLPVLTSDLVASSVMTSLAAVIVGYFHSTTEVAFFRVAVPAAHMNMLVMTSFSVLFTPSAARLFARKDFAGINDLYWKTTVWLAVMTFPIFVVTFSTSSSLTLLLFGERYAPSAAILALLALGYYFNVALGLNAQTLRVFGNVQYILAINLVSALLGLLVCFLLIPRFGALGAAVSTTATLIVRNLLTQIGLGSVTGVSTFEARYLKFYAAILGSALMLFAIEARMSLPIPLAFGLAALLSLIVFLAGRRTLDVPKMFPELLRFRFVRLIVG